ncbi:tautomerase family protein [Streptomyces sp. NPDC048106]|uniref:tautomerase family protein n=1 Tax=Streptomyces sp. NPDC048106 TaxID=3155750 RepID=UPI003451CE3F
MPVVTVDWWAGRQGDARKELVEEVSATVARIANCPVQAVTVIVRDVERSHWATGGRLADHD